MRVKNIVLAAGIALTLGACGHNTANRSNYSVNQPVVERSNYVLDLAPTSSGGLNDSEQARLAGWFDAINLRYGDRIAIDNPGLMADAGLRTAVRALAGDRGLQVAGIAPVTTGQVPMGTVRVVVSRSTASVPNCPNWSHRSHTDFQGRTSENYGCGVNSTMAAMIADPEDFVRGTSDDGRDPFSRTAPIENYRNANGGNP